MEGVKNCETCEYYLEAEYREEIRKKLAEGREELYKKYPELAPCKCKQKGGSK